MFQTESSNMQTRKQERLSPSGLTLMARWPDGRLLRPDLVGIADRPELPKDAFPDGIRIHFHFDGVYNGCKAAGKGTRMANEIMQKDLAHDDERYNPITDAEKNVNKGAEGLDCVHEMNTINHYVGMFPIAYRRAGGKAAGQVLLRLLA
jgi:hypothetical protein